MTEIAPTTFVLSFRVVNIVLVSPSRTSPTIKSEALLLGTRQHIHTFPTIIHLLLFLNK